MKDIAIVTIYGETNFGNKLQNYALEQLYLKNNYKVTTIRYIPYQTDNCLKNVLINWIDTIKKSKRNIKFENFSQKYLHLSPNKIKLNRPNKYSNYLNSFNYVSVGNDQVWNDEYLGKYSLEYFLLSNVKPEKRIASAPSIASNKIRNEEKFFKELSKYKLLSCREKSGVFILEKLLNRDVKHLMDPTLAIDKEDWNKLILNSKSNIPHEKYIFVYILGDTDQDFLKSIYVSYPNLKIVNILEKETEYYFSGPIEFIDYIKNAEIIVTNSFHGLVFAIIYNKKIYVLNRNNTNMNSRIQTLFQWFEIDIAFDKLTLIKERDYLFIEEKLNEIQKNWNDYIALIR